MSATTFGGSVPESTWNDSVLPPRSVDPSLLIASMQVTSANDQPWRSHGGVNEHSNGDIRRRHGYRA